MTANEFKDAVFKVLQNGYIGKLCAEKSGMRSPPMPHLTRSEKRRAMRDFRRLDSVDDVHNVPFLPLLVSFESVEVLKNVICYAIGDSNNE